LLIAASTAASIHRAGGWEALDPLTAAAAAALLGNTAAVALAFVLVWVATAVAFDRLSRLPGLAGYLASTAWRVLVPATTRVVATTALSVGTVGGLSVASAAVAADVPPPPVDGPTTPSELPSVDRPATSVRAATRSAQAAVQPARAPVTVMPGDSLWRIAARHLGPRATTSAIATEWPRWYDANRAQIGPDPDLVMVGVQLRVPAAGQVAQ
jgi:nucleoid-associated protein YgaU